MLAAVIPSRINGITSAHFGWEMKNSHFSSTRLLWYKSKKNTSLLVVCRSRMDLRVRWRHWGRTGRRVGESQLMLEFLKFTNKSRVSMCGRQVRSQFTERRQRNHKEKVAWGEIQSKKKKRELSADGHDFRLQTAEQELHPSYRAMNHEARLKVSEATLRLSLDFQRFFPFIFF